MGFIFSNVAANQSVFTHILIIGGAATIALAAVLFALRGRSITLPSLRASSLPRVRRDIVLPIATLAIAAALAIAFLTHGSELKAFLQTSYPSVANLIERIGTAELGLFTLPTAPAPSDEPLRRSLAEIGCGLKLQEGTLTVSGMDECISSGSNTPDQVFLYISGEGLGTSWAQLSENEKKIAVEKAKADAAADAQLIPLAKSLGISFVQLRHQTTQ